MCVESDGPDLEQNPVVERLLAAENMGHQKAYFIDTRTHRNYHRGSRRACCLPPDRAAPQPGGATTNHERRLIRQTATLATLCAIDKQEKREQDCVRPFPLPRKTNFSYGGSS
jgi:hypothetical protein